jgi:hypothetical protein
VAYSSTGMALFSALTSLRPACCLALILPTKPSPRMPIWNPGVGRHSDALVGVVTERLHGAVVGHRHGDGRIWACEGHD